MAKVSSSKRCDDVECVWCKSDDGEAAFWDEFFYACDVSENGGEEADDRIEFTVLDEKSGKELRLDEFEFGEGIRIIEE